VFLKTANDRSTYRLIMLATTGLLATTLGYGLFSLASVSAPMCLRPFHHHLRTGQEQNQVKRRLFCALDSHITPPPIATLNTQLKAYINKSIQL
jgi:hypothetical protein